MIKMYLTTGEVLEGNPSNFKLMVRSAEEILNNASEYKCEQIPSNEIQDALEYLLEAKEGYIQICMEYNKVEVI